MSAIRLFHASDLHYSPDHLQEVDRCFGFAIDKAIELECDVAIIAGDLFHRRIDLHSPPVAALLWRVKHLADHMPVLILQGTYSHDAPGCLDVFRTLGGRNEVFVADRICQVCLSASAHTWHTSPRHAWEGPAVTDSWPGDSALMASCLPAINKAAVAAAAGPENAGAEAGELVADVLRSWAPANLAARAAGVPTVGVGHGTVVGSINEQGVPMAGLDHEFTTGALLAAECDVFALGHIHQHQGWWSDDGRAIAYAGSVGRLHFGELSAKGFIAWTIEDGVIETRFHETPAKTLIEFEFDGPPDMGTFMEYLESKKKLVEGAHVRVKFTIDEEFRYEVDKAAIEDLFIEFGAEVVKIVGTINPVQRTRAAGITESDSIETKLAKWAEVTDCDPGPLLERLAKLQTCDEQDYRKLLEPPLPAPEEKAEEAATPAPETRHEFGAAGGTSVAV